MCKIHASTSINKGNLPNMKGIKKKSFKLFVNIQISNEYAEDVHWFSCNNVSSGTFVYFFFFNMIQL